MTLLRNLLSVLSCLLLLACSQGQNPAQAPLGNMPSPQGVVGGPFENGDFMYIGMPENIPSVDTSAGWQQPGQKLLITGTIYQLDGKTPAPNVILYYYHTDVGGLYSAKAGLDQRVTRHGSIRGWVQSDAEGKYAIYTVRPGPYPNSREAAHIHPAIKEPGIDKEYYIDGFVFDDDPLLTSASRQAMQNRGGSGVLRLLPSGDLHIAEHDIILGLNIPNYPKQIGSTARSGRHIGEDILSFTPRHTWGPDKGSKACPICKYGRYQGILYFVGNDPDWEEIKKWLLFLEQESSKREQYLKVYFVYGNPNHYAAASRAQELETLGQELKLQKTALTFVPSFTDQDSDIYLNEINPVLKNTFLIYRHSTIVDKYLELDATAANFQLIARSLDRTRGEYFYLEGKREE